MTKENNNLTNTANAPQKRRWYSNVLDLYRVTKRTYPWISWVFPVLLIVPVVVAVALCIYFQVWVLNFIFYVIFAFGLGLLGCTIMLTQLGNKAMYAQLEGVKGNVYAVMRSIKRGWIVEEQPVAYNRHQDLVWRLVGRPGIVLISEGPSSRAGELLSDEARKCSRVAPKVPVHTIQSGSGTGQIKLGQLMRHINKLKKQISKEEVPVVANRLQSLAAKGAPIPKGIDPNKVKINRRQLRGK